MHDIHTKFHGYLICRFNVVVSAQQDYRKMTRRGLPLMSMGQSFSVNLLLARRSMSEALYVTGVSRGPSVGPQV